MTNPQTPGPIYVVMGVTGSGKSTTGKMLAAHLGLPFYDSDNFHTEESREKLAKDIPLNDADREPWLNLLARRMTDWSKSGGAVLACSALKHSYRSKFRAAAPTVYFIYLSADPAVIARRLDRRGNEGEHVISQYHDILQAQYRDLEIPDSAIKVNVDQPPAELLNEIVQKLAL